MKLEIKALEANNTWEIIDKIPGTVTIGSKWVYKIKRKSDGSIERYKARLVTKGYIQTEEIDYLDTFSPVAKITTVRLLLALASIKHWHVQQLDVNNAFLYRDLTEEVYMDIPQGVPCDSPNKICKLLKSLYGLKQASCKWYEKLSSVLIQLGYKQASLFSKADSHNHFIALLIYVDDIILAWNSLSEIQFIKATLDKQFGIKDLGILKYFLGLETAHSSKGISLCQCQYCLDLLAETGTSAAKPVSTPIAANTKLHQDSSLPYTDVEGYRLIGRLLYLTTTRPNICFAMQQLSQLLAAPTMSHYHVAQKVLRYLKGCPGKGISFPRNSSLQLLGFVDADWAGCPDTRRSVSGYWFFLGDSLISWRSKKQLTVARSSSEAEYRSLGSATCELQWLHFLLQDLVVPYTKESIIYCDNQSALILLLTLCSMREPSTWRLTATSLEKSALKVWWSYCPSLLWIRLLISSPKDSILLIFDHRFPT